VVSVGDAGMRILAQAGSSRFPRVRLDEGAKVKSTEPTLLRERSSAVRGVQQRFVRL